MRQIYIALTQEGGKPLEIEYRQDCGAKWSLHTVFAVTGKWVRVEHHIDVTEVTAAMRRLKESNLPLVIRYERA